MADRPALPQPADGRTVVLADWNAAVAYARSRHGGALNAAFDAAAAFNWIVPLGALIHQLVFGGVGFAVPDIGGGALFDDLKRRGVRVSWRDLRGGVWIFNVPGAQARYTCHLLDQAGLPYRHSPIPRRFRAGGRGARKAGRARIFDRIKNELFN